MVSPPYSLSNPQRPDYVDEIKCNWTGHNVDALGVFVCKVNTTAQKHAALAKRAGVRAMPAGITWETSVRALTSVKRTEISNWCANKGIPYDSTETVGQFLTRVICSGLFSLGLTKLGTRYADLTQEQMDKIARLRARHRQAALGEDETVRGVVDKLGPDVWPGDKLDVAEY